MKDFELFFDNFLIAIVQKETFFKKGPLTSMVPSIVRAGVIAKFEPYILVCTEWDEILFDFFRGRGGKELSNLF